MIILPTPRSSTSSSGTAFADFCPDRFFWATRFLANVHYMLSPVRLSSVCKVRSPHSAGWNFRQFSMPFGTLAIHWHPWKFLQTLSQRNPSIGGLNAREVAKYSDFGPIEGYIGNGARYKVCQYEFLVVFSFLFFFDVFVFVLFCFRRPVLMSVMLFW